MITYKQLLEQIQHESMISLDEAVSSNDKGVLHELLVGKALNGGKHMSDEAKTKHDDIVSRISPDELKDHEKLAHGTAKALVKRFGQPESTHWSSKPGDIGRITNTHETQQENPSDIILRHKDGSHVGISLKVTQKKHGHVQVGNPGAKQTDAQLGTSAVSHYDNAKKELVDAHPELKGKSITDQKAIVKGNPEILSHAKSLTNHAI